MSSLLIQKRHIKTFQIYHQFTTDGVLNVLPQDEIEFDDLQIQLALAFGNSSEVKEEDQEEEEEESPAEPDESEAHPASSQKKKPGRRKLTRRDTLQKFCSVGVVALQSPSNTSEKIEL